MFKLKQKLENMSAPVKAALFFTICNVLQKGISLISAPIFTRLLTTEQYGLFTIYNSWYGIISIFATFNLSYGIFIKGLVKYEDDSKRFASLLLGLSTTITFACFLVYLIGMNFWNSVFELPSFLILAMFLELLFVPAFGFWSNIQRNEYKYKALVLVTLEMSLANPLLGIVTVLSTIYKAEARILSMVFVQVIFGLFFYILIMYKGRRFYDKKYWKYAFLFNAPLIPHYLSMTVLQQVDRIMINNMVGTSEAAIYGVAYTVSTLMILVTSAMNNSFTPFTYQSIKKKNYISIKSITNLILIIVAVGCILVMAFGPEVISILAPKQYYDAIWIIPPVAASVFFMFLYPLFGNIEFYYEKTKFTMMASCVGAVANIVLNYVFIRIFGYHAAGYTTLACYIMFAIAHYAVYRKIIKEKEIETIYDIKNIVLISIFVLIAIIAILFTYNYTIIRYSIIALIIVIAIIKRKTVIEIIKRLKKRN